MLKKFSNELFRKIVEYNSREDHEAIPHSDLFEKEVQSLMGIGKADLDQIIKILKDSHKILSFEIIKEDSENDIKRIDGYVEADLQTIRKLKNIFQKLLMDEYEKQMNKRLMVHQVIKDIYSRPNFYKNTLIGQIGNKAIMLNEYEILMERNFNEYTDTWKTKKFSELLASMSDKLPSETAAPAQAAPEAEKAAEKVQRAVDSPLYKSYSTDKAKQSIDKVLELYGVNFFFRINLRKYNFDLLREILESGAISQRQDLILIKELIQKTKANVGNDPGLLDHTDKLYKLERIVSRQIHYSH
jgi:hypothetical protein